MGRSDDDCGPDCGLSVGAAGGEERKQFFQQIVQVPNTSFTNLSLDFKA